VGLPLQDPLLHPLDRELLHPPQPYHHFIKEYPELLTSSDRHVSQPVSNAKAEANRYWGMGNMFLEHDWPDNFRGDEFEEARRKWNEEVKAMERRAKDPVVDYEGPPRIMRLAQGLEQFYCRAAGDKAV